MEQILSVEETQIKDKKCILLRIKGGKQFVLQCEVSFSVFKKIFPQVKVRATVCLPSGDGPPGMESLNPCFMT